MVVVDFVGAVSEEPAHSRARIFSFSFKKRCPSTEAWRGFFLLCWEDEGSRRSVSGGGWGRLGTGDGVVAVVVGSVKRLDFERMEFSNLAFFAFFTGRGSGPVGILKR